MKIKDVVVALIKGVCIGVFLSVLGMETFSFEWWTAAIALTIAFNV